MSLAAGADAPSYAGATGAAYSDAESCQAFTSARCRTLPILTSLAAPPFSKHALQGRRAVGGAPYAGGSEPTQLQAEQRPLSLHEAATIRLWAHHCLEVHHLLVHEKSCK